MAKASSAIAQNTTWCPVAMNATISTTSRMASPRFSLCWPGKVIGEPLISACSLANAMTEPEKVMAPIARPSDISTRLSVWTWPSVPMPNASGAFSAAAATNTAAMPTREWNAATSCGSAVILMRCATTAPIAPPMTMPSTISP